MEGQKAGRSRGRARARPQLSAQPLIQYESQDEPSTSAHELTMSSGKILEEEAGAVRGKGGLRGPFITRPKNVTLTAGSDGLEIKLFANVFKLQLPTDQIISQYHFSFEPEVLSSKVRRGSLFGEGRRFGAACVYDGDHDIKTLDDIPKSQLSFTALRNTDNTQIKITLKKVGTLSFGSFEMLRLYNT